jgi:hypothetical protein
MHGIDLGDLNEAELIALHNAVVDRLHYLHQQKTTHALLELAIGERVVFEDNYGQPQAGIVIRRSRKTVTVHGDNGRQWNVSPQLLRKEKRAGEYIVDCSSLLKIHSTGRAVYVPDAPQTAPPAGSIGVLTAIEI